MTIENDVWTALSGVASGKRYPEFVAADIARPYVIIRRLNYAPLTTLNRSEQIILSTFILECHADSKEAANALAVSAMAAIMASSTATLKQAFEEDVSGEDYQPETMELMTPRQFGVWHPT